MHWLAKWARRILFAFFILIVIVAIGAKSKPAPSPAAPLSPCAAKLFHDMKRNNKETTQPRQCRGTTAAQYAAATTAAYEQYTRWLANHK